VVYYQNRIVTPNSLRKITLQQMHAGHNRIVKTYLRAKKLMYWTRLKNEVQKNM